MKKHVLIILAGLFLAACTADNSEQKNTGNGSQESPTNGIPTGTGLTDSATKDHTRVDQDTLHP